MNDASSAFFHNLEFNDQRGRNCYVSIAINSKSGQGEGK